MTHKPRRVQDVTSAAAHPDAAAELGQQPPVVRRPNG